MFAFYLLLGNENRTKSGDFITKGAFGTNLQVEDDVKVNGFL
jgi:hypothetical protein